jgi:hypothetical protein
MIYTLSSVWNKFNTFVSLLWLSQVKPRGLGYCEFLSDSGDEVSDNDYEKFVEFELMLDIVGL